MKLFWKIHRQHHISNREYSFLYYFLAIFSALSLIISIPIWFLISQYNNDNLKIIKLREIGNLNIASQSIQRDFFGMIANVGVVAKAPIIKKFLSENKQQDKEMVTNLMTVMAEHYQRYNQVRILDLSGNEVIRINYTSGKSNLVKPEDLQNKYHSAYFYETLNLKEGEIYISPMELNIEQNRIEVPSHPTIRVGTPLFNNNGVKVGIFIVNYDATNLIDNFKRVIQESDDHIGMLINSDSYYLVSQTEAEEFGFMYQNEAFKLSKKLPDVWKSLIERRKKYILNDQGLFIFDTVYPLKRESGSGINKRIIKPVGVSEIQTQNYLWHIVLHVSNKELSKVNFVSNYLMMYVLVTVYALIGLVSVLICTVLMKSKIQVAAERNAFLKMKDLAQIDGLTNIYNRRSFCELAERDITKHRQSTDISSLMVLDIDHFKKINDIHGHDIGDQAIKSFCAVCEKILRESDIFGRMGGEEFAIFMAKTTLEQARIIAERVRKAVSEIVLNLPEGSVSFTVSIGITCAKYHSCDLNLMLKEADKAMYLAKNCGRDQICVSYNNN